MAGYAVQTKAYLSEASNAMVLELSTDSGKEVPLQATLSVIGNEYVALGAGAEGSVAWVTKEPNTEGAPFYVKGAVAAKVLGTESVLTSDSHTYSKLSFALPANGEVVKIFLQAEHSKNAPSPLPSVRDTAQEATLTETHDIYVQHQAWWKQFWLHAYIELGDDIQKYWYNHLHLMGSAARSGSDNAPGKAPGHWGPWNRGDDMMWFSNVSVNYNGQNPYYGTSSSNHVDLVDPYIETIRYYSENTGRKRVANRWVSPEIEARMPADCRGVAFELSFTSHGTSCGGGSWLHEDGCMPTNAIFGILPLVWKWKYGQDAEYLNDTCYPLMREVADFYDDYIGEPVDGRYDVYGSVHEGANWFSANDMFSLGAVQFLYREIIAASIKLGRDADRRTHWQDILAHMSGYQLQAWGNTVTFRPDGVHDVMAVRAGYRPDRVIDAIKGWKPEMNGIVSQKNGGGIETAGIIEAINNMLLQSHDGVIRIFPNWDRTIDAKFTRLRAVGAFLVTASYSASEQAIDSVRIFSETGNTCVVQSPFGPVGDSCIQVIRTDTQQVVATVRNEEEFTFATTAGVTYEITRADCAPPPAGTPVIVTQPVDTTITLPAAATFTISASGDGLIYQWQKNRIDIPGATSPSYTTPATTLRDIGSAYRCVVSNLFGIARSRPGKMNPDRSVLTPTVSEHPILGVWSYQHAGRNYTREFTSQRRYSS